MPTPPILPIGGFDPVAAFLRRPLQEIIGEQAPPTIAPPEPVPRSIPALHTLSSQYAWVAVLELSTSLLAASDEPPQDGPDVLCPHQRMICTLYRTVALLQTRQLDRAANAIDSLGDLSDHNVDHRYESYPDQYTDRRGSFVPFELKLLSVDVRVRRGDTAAICDAYALLQQLPTDNASEMLARRRVLLSAICSYHLKAQQLDSAVDVAQQLVQALNDTDDASTAPRDKSHAWYMYGRVLLHAGDVDGAKRAFAHAQTHLTVGNPSPSEQAMAYAHQAMELAARGKFSEAIVEYDQAAQLAPHDGYVRVMVANNAAMCFMHVGRLAEAVDRLEGALRRGPELALDEGVVFNLATLYDLAFPDSAVEKKKVLQRLASRFGRQGFDLENVGLS